MWDFQKGRLSGDFAYQVEENFMLCAGAVLSLDYVVDSGLIVAGCDDGFIRVSLRCHFRYGSFHLVDV